MKSLEENVIDAMNKALLEHADRLSALRIEWEPPSIEVWHGEEHDYTSEARVYFKRNGQLHDVLEFHIFRGGRSVVTVKEVDEWLKQQLAELK